MTLRLAETVVDEICMSKLIFAPSREKYRSEGQTKTLPKYFFDFQAQIFGR